MFEKFRNNSLKNCVLYPSHYLSTPGVSYAMSKFLPTSGFKWIDSKEFDLNKYTSNSSKGKVLEGGFDYPKELRELHNDYPLAPDQIYI